MRYIIIPFLSSLFFSCNSGDTNKLPGSQNDKLSVNYDSIKFNHRIIPDTTGYQWITEKRAILDTLRLEKAVLVVATPDTFLSLPKYKRLWSCPLPFNIMVPSDTVLISGFIYEILPSNGGKGYPTFITQLLYSDRK